MMTAHPANPVKMGPYGPIHPILARHKALLVAFMILNLADAILTIHFVDAGLASEANPLMKAIMDQGYEYFLAFKLVIGASAIWTFGSMSAYRFATWIMYSVVGIYSFVVAYSLMGFFL